MRIVLHIGPDPMASLRARRAMQRASLPAGMAAASAELCDLLSVAALPMGHVDVLRAIRGVTDAEAVIGARREFSDALAKSSVQTLLVGVPHLGAGLLSEADLRPLLDLLSGHDVRILLQGDTPARMAAHGYAAQVLSGRTRSPALELGLAPCDDWRVAALASAPPTQAEQGLLGSVQGAPAWLDLEALHLAWAGAFGANNITRLGPSDGLPVGDIGAIALADPPPLPSARWLARARAFSRLHMKHIAEGGAPLPQSVWMARLAELSVPGDPLDARVFAPLDAAFGLAGDDALPFVEPPFGQGFRATQFLAAALKRQAEEEDARLTAKAEALLPAEAKVAFAKMAGGPMAPKVRPAQPVNMTPVPQAQPDPGFGIVACMKNEAPYILEWLAFHRMAGFGRVRVYSNDCDDGTDLLLTRLAQRGLIEHCPLSGWEGSSPQQHALNHFAEDQSWAGMRWVTHIDVDEFVNVRIGDGTVQALVKALPEATHIAMTWRLFGHGGQHQIEDGLLIEQFTDCAPAHCPSPHQAWGMKTLGQPGHYARLSGHRPNKRLEGAAPLWVNGSGRDVTADLVDSGWRSSRGTVGYDLVQLNHYAVRSLDGFLVKRKRGRALHVGRSVGENYWVRMDWSGDTDRSIQRSARRVKAELARLLDDPVTARLHQLGLRAHRARARSLRATVEGAEFAERLAAIDLRPLERTAWASILDPET